jgi:hypothetical protein
MVKHHTSGEIVQSTLDMLVLRTLVIGPSHGHTLAHVIEHASENVLEVEQGSLYPALHRLRRAAGSLPSGVPARTIDALSSTSSPLLAEGSSRSRVSAGARSSPPLSAFSVKPE